MVVILTLLSRYSTIGAEDRLLESQKKIAGLTGKLKIYLPREGEVLVRVREAGICGTDFAKYRGNLGRRH
jgi:threonine dehydrogenase-like Zn-dependent dehydrogenase